MRFRVGRYVCEMTRDANGRTQIAWWPQRPVYLDRAERTQYRSARDTFQDADMRTDSSGSRARPNWRVLRSLAPALLALTLLGCESAQEIAAREAAESARFDALLDRLFAAIDGECRSRGFAPNSVRYVHCHDALLQAWEVGRANQQAAAALGRQQSEAAIWAEWRRNVDAMQSPPPRRPLNCTSMPIGNTVQTNCY